MLKSDHISRVPLTGQVLAMAMLLIGLPPLGILLAGRSVRPYLEFPPLTHHVSHGPFSWIGFGFLTVVNIGMLMPLVVAVGRNILWGRHHTAEQDGPSCRFPWWGWAGLTLTISAWIIAWNRFEWAHPVQPFTFSPLWVGYILVVNALTFKRSGRCMLVDRPSYFWALFPLSATVWWFFEYLNRFVQNWYYLGIEDFTPLEYAVYATIPFATVLPAVLGTQEWLETSSGLQQALRRLWRIRIRAPRVLAGTILLAAAAGLSGLGIWPGVLYPLLWVSPLLIITSLQILRGESTIFAPVAHGDWRPIYFPALAALICGVFWEMWNFYSAAKWVYAVPYVSRYLIFEMPVLGYGGYVPFGLECAVIGALLERRAGRAMGRDG